MRCGASSYEFSPYISLSLFLSLSLPLSLLLTLCGLRSLCWLVLKSRFALSTISRGAIIDQSALVDALRENRIAGAALDVFGEGSAPPPPLPEDSALYGLDNVILTPHIGWQRLEARQRVVDMCVENIDGFLRGEPCNIDMDTGMPRAR